MSGQPRVSVMKMGLLHVNACVAADATPDEIIAGVERECPCGTTLGWQLQTERLPSGDPARVTCASDPSRVHVVLLA